jgi:hypothetical protein
MHNKQQRTVAVITHNAQFRADYNVMTKMGTVTGYFWNHARVNKLKPRRKANEKSLAHQTI